MSSFSGVSNETFIFVFDTQEQDEYIQPLQVPG
jgi:hypothetical protein